MNEQLQEALTTLLDKSLNAVDFMVAELPEVIQQLLVWKMWESAIWSFLGITLAMIISIGTCLLYKKDESSESYMWFPIGTVLALIAIAAMCDFDWLQILIAPKVYLIEYAASLAK